MRIHPAGTWPIIVIFLLVAGILYVLNLVFPVQSHIHYFLYFVAVVFLFLVVRFFRRPDRKLVKNDNFVYSAADGHIVAVEEVYEKEYFNEKRLQVSVFMSLVNAHVNWFSISGKIKYNHHKKGRFYAAYLPKSSEENERNSIVVEDRKGREIMIRQIAGVAARRIITKARVGDDAVQGDELGMIRFGSRVDHFLPPDSKVLVKINQEVRGKITVLAELEDK